MEIELITTLLFGGLLILLILGVPVAFALSAVTVVPDVHARRSKRVIYRRHHNLSADHRPEFDHDPFVYIDG